MFKSNLTPVSLCKDDLCKLFDKVINYTNDIGKTKDSGLTDLMKEFPNLLTNLHQKRENVANESLPVLVLGMFSRLQWYKDTYIFAIFRFML